MTGVVVRVDEGIRFIGIDRPGKRNALDDDLVAELTMTISATRESPMVTVFHSTTPGMFIAGADIARLRERTALDAARRINAALFDAIAAMPWPTIAMVDGAALGGGCEFTLACDFRLASTRARFAQPELGLGIIAAAGANHRLERLVGLGVARRMLLAGESLSAADALRVGLVDGVCEPEELETHARELAGRIGRNSWAALEYTKRALETGTRRTDEIDVEAQSILFESPEKRDRMDAFLHRRASHVAPLPTEDGTT